MKVKKRVEWKTEESDNMDRKRTSENGWQVDDMVWAADIMKASQERSWSLARATCHQDVKERGLWGGRL